MGVQIFQIPGVNEDGFQPIHGLRQAAQRLGRDGFLDAYPAPALLVVSLSPNEESLLGGLDSVGSPQLLTLAGPGLRPLRYLERVAFLVKGPGKPFPHLISLGRSSSNDLVVALEDISKLHGYFTCGRVDWAFTDQGSTNGSQLNDRPLEASKRQLLADGDLLGIGGGIVFEFLLPETLWRRLSASA